MGFHADTIEKLRSGAASSARQVEPQVEDLAKAGFARDSREIALKSRAAAAGWDDLFLGERYDAPHDLHE